MNLSAGRTSSPLSLTSLALLHEQVEISFDLGKDHSAAVNV